MSKARLNRIRGVDGSGVRIDEELYQDFENEGEKKVRGGGHAKDRADVML